jgi:AcrR family transcriptional regulator
MPGSAESSSRRDEGSRRKGRATRRAATPAAGSAPRRRSGAATQETILSAAEQEFSLRGLDGATVREIATRAGVTHALVHRYFGTKDDLYKAVLARNEDLIRDAAAGVDGLTQAAALMLREGLAHHRPYLRLIVDSALRGVPFESTVVNFSATERLIELARLAAPDDTRAVTRDDDDVATDAETTGRLAVVMAVTLYLGWAAAGHWVVAAGGLRDLDEETLTAALERAVTILFEGFLAPPVGPAAGGEQSAT